MLDFRILGPFEVIGREPLPLGGRKQQTVLVSLLLRRGEVVTADRLIEAVWGERPPATAAKTLQVYVSNLRKALGDGQLVTQARGYVLAAEPDQVDADRFAKLAKSGRDALQRGNPEQAQRMLGAALAMWRGPALADFAYENFAEPEIARLEEARLVALEDRIEAELRLGQHTALVPELEALVVEHPLRERLYEQLMVALYRSGRQVDALDRYQRARGKLIDEFGIEPSPRLQEVQRAVLSHDPSLDLPGPAASVRPSPPRRRRVWVLVAGACALIALVVVLLTSGGGGGRAPAVPAGTVRILLPPAGGVYARGERVATQFRCLAPSHGPRVRTCRDSGGNTAGSGSLDTSSLGSHRYTVVMTLTNGARRTTAIGYAVVALRVAIDSPRATASGGRASVTLVCLGGGQGATCRGTLTLARHGATLARGTYSLRAGAMRSFALGLTRAGTRQLRHARHHRLRAVLTATMPLARPAQRTITLQHRRR